MTTPAPAPPHHRPAIRPRRRLWRWVALICVLLFVVLNAAGALQAWRLMHFADPSSPPVKFEQMSFTDRLAFAVTGGFSQRSRARSTPNFPYSSYRLSTPDGLTLAVWESTDAGNTSATVILCHGHGANKSTILPEALVFRHLGYRVVMFDFRAHGESTGQVCSVGHYEAADVKAVWDRVQKDHPGQPVILYGISMGAVASARAASLYGLKPRALILDMPYNRLVDAVRSRVRMMHIPPEPIASMLTFWGGVELGFWSFGYATSDYMKNIKSPVLLQWGEADNRVTKAEILTIQKSATGPLSLVTYPGVGHTSLAKKAGAKWTQAVETLLTINASPAHLHTSK